jgi:transposase
MLGARVHTREFKLELMRQLADGEKRPAQVCREYNLAQSLLLRWRKEFQDRGEAAFTPRGVSPAESLERRVAELERLCGQLALENAVLKKASRTLGSRSATP